MQTSSPVLKATLHPPFSWNLFLNPFLETGLPVPLDKPSVRSYLRASDAVWNGIKLLGLTHRFWDQFHPQFPKGEYEAASFLKSYVVALPIHQYISDSSLGLMRDALRAWTESEH